MGATVPTSKLPASERVGNVLGQATLWLMAQGRIEGLGEDLAPATDQAAEVIVSASLLRDPNQIIPGCRRSDLGWPGDLV